MPGKPENNTLNELIEEHRPKFIVGIDEVGWGAVAGPLVLACTVYPIDAPNIKIRDSKAYSSEKAREKAWALVTTTARYIGFHEVSCGNIEVFGPGAMIQQGFLDLATRAVSHFPESLVIIDGSNKIKGFDHPQVCLPKADTFVLAVSAASVSAKVSRDRTMTSLGEDFSEYEWCDNKGYGTSKHMKAIERVGVSIHHRRNIQAILDLEEKHGTYGRNRQ